MEGNGKPPLVQLSPGTFGPGPALRQNTYQHHYSMLIRLNYFIYNYFIVLVGHYTEQNNFKLNRR